MTILTTPTKVYNNCFNDCRSVSIFVQNTLKSSEVDLMFVFAAIRDTKKTAHV